MGPVRCSDGRPPTSPPHHARGDPVIPQNSAHAGAPRALLRRPLGAGAALLEAGRSAGSAPATRLEWVDTARGAAIALVALYHAVLFTEGLGLTIGPWATINEALQSFRMPLFFLVSGFLVARGLHRPWGELGSRKIATWAWLYLVWSLLSAAVFLVVPWTRPGHPADSPSDVLGIAVWPDNGLWYLFALVVFAVALKLTLTWRAPPVLALALVLAVLSSTGVLATGNFAFDNMGRYFLFFAVGARAPGLVLAVAARVTRRRTVALTAVYGALTSAIVLGGLLSPLTMTQISALPLVGTVWELLAAVTGVALAVMIAETALGRGLAFLGRRTLPVYVAHEALLGCLAAAVGAVGALPPLTGLALPLLLAAAAIPLTLVLHRVLGGVPGLYRVPRRSWDHRPA